MSSSGRINNLRDPSATQDAATKSYVDSKTTDMATTAYVTGTSWANNPTVADNSGNANYRVVFTNGITGRASLLTNGELYYNPNGNTLTAGTFNGNATYAGKAGYVVYGINNGGWRLYCNGNTGYIGIGTTEPAYPVDIIVTNKNSTTDNANSYWWGQGSSGTGINKNNIIGTPVAMRINGSIWIESTTQWVGFWATSDRRIKKI